MLTNGVGIMEFRKLINFGKTSYVVSLPKDWVVKNNLKKGDLIAIKEDEASLIIGAGSNEKINKEPTEINISIDNKELTRVKREIVAAYINNINIINITGKNLSSKAKEIRDILQNLMALEIIEQSSTKIMAKDFLNMEKISLQNLMRKMDIITRDMFSDSKLIFKEDKSENIYLRDEDVNRISFLIFRALKYALENPDIAKKYGIKSSEVLKLWEFTISVEKVADEVKRFARFMKKAELKDASAKRIFSLYSKIEKAFLDTMKSYYNNNYSLAYDVSELKDSFISECNEIWSKYWGQKMVPDIVNKMKRLSSTIHNMGRIIYSYT